MDASEGQSVKLHPYQTEAAEWLTRQRRGVVCLAAGGGKTIVAAAALAMVVKAKPRTAPVRIGWLANTLEQCQQAERALDTFGLRASQDVKVACAAAATDWSDRDVLVVDECHHAAALGWFTQVQTCQGARWGLTATPPEDRILAALMREALGDTFTIARERVAQRLAPAVVRWLDDTDHDLRPVIDAEIEKTMRWRRRFWKGDPGQLWGQVAWQVCIDLGIVANKARNAAAISAASSARQTLVLVNKVEHAHALAGKIQDALACYSGMGAAARRRGLEAFTANRLRCIVATSLADEGLDLPNAEVLVLVSAGRSKARTEQRTGRVLRAFAGKPHGVIYDFRDSYHPLPAKHARIRAELYQSLGYRGV